MDTAINVTCSYVCISLWAEHEYKMARDTIEASLLLKVLLTAKTSYIHIFYLVTSPSHCGAT